MILHKFLIIYIRQKDGVIGVGDKSPYTLNYKDLKLNLLD